MYICLPFPKRLSGNFHQKTCFIKISSIFEARHLSMKLFSGGFLRDEKS